MVWKLHGNSQIVRAYVPLTEMFGYATVLRSASQGRGTFMMVLTTTKMYLSQYKKKSLRKTKVKTNLSSLEGSHLWLLFCLSRNRKKYLKYGKIEGV